MCEINQNYLKSFRIVDLCIAESICNLSCIYCSPNDNSHLPRKHFSTQIHINKLHDLLSIISRVPSVSLLKVSGGEITLLENVFRELAETFVSKFPYVQLLTNGTRWNASDLNWWQSFGNTMLQISLDALSIAGNTCRGIKHSQLSNIINLLNHSHSTSLPTEICCVITKYNILELSSFFMEASKRWPNTIIYPFPVRGVQELLFFFFDFNIFWDDYKELEFKLTNVPPSIYFEDLKAFFMNSYERTKPCFMSIIGKGIVDDRNVYYCPCSETETVGVLNPCDYSTLNSFIDMQMPPESINTCKSCFTHYEIINYLVSGKVDMATAHSYPTLLPFIRGVDR